MKLDPALLEILACPDCKAPLRADEAASELVHRVRAGLPGSRRHPRAPRRRGPHAHVTLDLDEVPS